MEKEEKYTITVHKTSHFRKTCVVSAKNLEEAKQKGLDLMVESDDNENWQWDGSGYQLNTLGLCHKIAEHEED